MTEITTNIIIGGLIVVLNLIPIILKKYKLIGVTSAISLLLVVASQYLS